MSELRVWFVLRALTLLRHRYADAWSALFEPPGRTPLLVAFDDYPTAIAASFTARGGPGSPGVPVVLVHPGHAGGEDPECGSAAIYRSGDSATDFLRYMSDGLVETLVHEMLHVYVEAASASDPACRFLSTSPARAEGARDAWIATEECVIANTSLGYFARAGGLSKDVRSYYAHLTSRWIEYARTSPATLDESIADVMSLGVSGRIPRDGDFVRTLRLRVLDPPPGATTR
jgi:hypothetical protein